MSPGYLARFFKKVTGTTLSGYIMRYRVDKAKELLSRQDLSVSQVAFAAGFESHSYFDRTFRRLVHMSPGEFRQQYGRNAAQPGRP
jgi:two-component system response regulator YesN